MRSPWAFLTIVTRTKLYKAVYNLETFTFTEKEEEQAGTPEFDAKKKCRKIFGESSPPIVLSAIIPNMDPNVQGLMAALQPFYPLLANAAPVPPGSGSSSSQEIGEMRSILDQILQEQRELLQEQRALSRRRKKLEDASEEKIAGVSNNLGIAALRIFCRV